MLLGWTITQQEQASSETAEKKLDIDEDRQNPAYIPRKGYFYEHDLRIEAGDATADKTEYSFSYVLCGCRVSTTYGNLPEFYNPPENPLKFHKPAWIIFLLD